MKRNDPNTESLAKFKSLISDYPRWCAMAAKALKNGGMNRAIAAECGCSTGVADKYVRKMGLSANRNAKPARRGDDYVKWLEMMTALEDAIHAIDDTAGDILDAEDRRELATKLETCRSIVLNAMPMCERKEPK